MSNNSKAYFDNFYSRLCSSDTTAILIMKRDQNLVAFQAQRCFLISSFRLRYPNGDKFVTLQYCQVEGLEAMDDFDHVAVLIDTQKSGVRITVVDTSYDEAVYSSKDEPTTSHELGVLTCVTSSATCFYYMISLFGCHTKGFLMSDCDESYEYLLYILDKNIFHRKECHPRPSLEEDSESSRTLDTGKLTYSAGDRHAWDF